MVRQAWWRLVAACGIVLCTATAPAPAQVPAPPPGDPTATPAPAPAAGEAPVATPLSEPAVGVTIDWEVRNRFRLFRDERDFRRHVAAEQGRSVVAAEQSLAAASDGRGWARDMVVRLCIDAAGRTTGECVRDGVRESYLTPADHRIEARLAGTVDPDASCAWTFEDGESLPRSITANCREPINMRAVYGRPTIAAVDITGPDGVPRRATTEILVRDLLVAGLGDSIASGEGNPDRPVALADEGFCFRRFGGGGRSEYFRPGRQGFRGDKACDNVGGADTDRTEWSRLSARWMSAPCHRSLYSYQLRAALALAVENPRVAVTFLPLACTGATIEVGLLGSQAARELTCGASGTSSCPANVPGQIVQLRDLLARARQVQPWRSLDLMFLTIGANDIDFSGLVADVIVEAPGERGLLRRSGVLGSVDAAEAALETTLPAAFHQLRGMLRPLLDEDLGRVVYVSYGHPGLDPRGGSCPGGRDGFDVHPAFGVDGNRMERVSAFVQNRFFPRLKALVTCSDGTTCADNGADSPRFVDAHQALFAEHGFCARAETDPEFDRDCFSVRGESFTASPVDGATAPLVCDLRPSEFRPYASRARWIRTANDSYFAAMTFPEGVSTTMQPSNLHDATWGILSAVYGGAIHPTAEGHAAMADAALVAARGVLHLPSPADTIISEPLPEPTPPQTAGAGDRR